MSDARIELLQRMAFFGGVKAATLEFLLGFSPVIMVAANDYFFREGDDGQSLYVLESGSARVLKAWRGEDCLIQTLTAGDCFGEMAVIDHCARSASVQAAEACAAIHISSAALHRVYAHDLKQFALIQMNMGREVSRRLRAANERLFGVEMEGGLPSAWPGSRPSPG